MVSSLDIESLTVAQVRHMLEQIVHYVPVDHFMVPNWRDKSTFEDIESSFKVPPWSGQWGKYASSKDRDEYMIRLCVSLRERAEKPKTHIKGIDEILSQLVNCRFFIHGIKPGSFEDDFASRALQVLKRLPSRPLYIMEIPDNINEHYFLEGSILGNDIQMDNFGQQAWESLRVTAFLSPTIIQMALYIVIAGDNVFGDAWEDFPNMLAELLETSSDLAAHCTSNEHQQWYIVRSALWSLWQRSMMLYNYANLQRAIGVGFTGNYRLKIGFRSTTPSPGMSIHEFSTLYATQGKPRAMCSWAFELLRTEPICLSVDFRTFYQRYSELWGNAAARCQKDSPVSCNGNDPDGCWRFKGMVVQNQSAHDWECPQQCPKLAWDQCLYRTVSGSRAVTTVLEKVTDQNRQLKYCSASERTMAISHVWSHGQGGRPDEGVNSCLHRRYAQIATKLGCDSYWWDAACIPEDHELRSEAIQNINSTFSNSKVILVCDRDLMSIDISNPTIQIKESILATVLVCDWNIRAWTFLESLRGRHNIRLLCNNNATISFREIVQDVADFGSIDLGILGFTVPHMLPENAGYIDTWSREEIGQVLSCRPASRQGDDVVIWSLLVTGEAYESPEKLWRHNVRIPDDAVQTGFLLSSAPRLGTRGLSWAPCTPYFKPQPENLSGGVPLFRASRGLDTWPGFITDKGLEAAWQVYEFDVSNVIRTSFKEPTLNGNQIAALEKISSLYLRDSDWGALLRTMSNISTFERDRETATKYNGLIKGTLVAVLGCNGQSRPSQKPAQDRGWRWKGVFEWDEHISLPQFAEEVDFLIE